MATMSETPKKPTTEKRKDFVCEQGERKKSGAPAQAGVSAKVLPVKEIGGQKGPEPTRYGDWEKGGRCTDF